MRMDRGSRRRFLRLFGAGGAVLFGCGLREPQRLPRKVVPIAEVPEALMAVAKKEFPDVIFDTAWQNLVGNGEVDSYEIRGKQPNGKIREVRVALDGRVLEKE